MKKILSIVLLCAILSLSCFFTSCKAPALEKEENGAFRNPKTGIVYYPASPNYYAKPTGKDPYARIEVGKGAEDFLLYQIGELDPERYLVSNAYTVYCAEGAELPALYDFPCSRVGIYDTQVASNDGNITEAADISALKELHKNGVFTTLSNVSIYMDMTTEWYDLHFMGEGTQAEIYYQLKYGVFVEDVLIVELVEDEETFVDLYPGIPYELMWETYGGEQYYVAKYNFGKEILCDVATGNCYKIEVENSLLPYITPSEDANLGDAQ